MSIAKLQGFTLPELLTTVAIVGVLSSISLPSLTDFIQQNAAESDINLINKIIYHARSSAIDSGQHVTICVLDSKNKCNKASDWRGTVSTFFDPNRNGTVDNGESMSHEIEAGKYASSIKWRAFNNRGYLQFSPLGLSTTSNGTFTYCSNGQQPMKQLIINRQGRLRISDKPHINARC